MADTDHQAALVVCDLADDGHIVRTSRYELLFSTTEKMASVQFRNTLHTTMELEVLRLTRHGAEEKMLDTAAKREPPLYQGHMPLTFTVGERLRQWTPISPGTRSIHEVCNHHKTVASCATELSTRNHHARLCCSTAEAFTISVPQPVPPKDGKSGRTSQTHRPTHLVGADLLRLIQEASVPSEGLFDIFSQISLTGAGNFEDLSLLDWSDPDQWLVLVLTRRGNDWFVFRKL